MKKFFGLRLEEDQIKWLKSQPNASEVVRDLIIKAMKENRIIEEKQTFPKCPKLKFHDYLKIHYCLDRVKAKRILPKYIKKAKVSSYDCGVCLEIRKERQPKEEQPKAKILTDQDRKNEYFTCSYKDRSLKIMDLPCVKDVMFNCLNKLCEKQIIEEYLK